LSVARAGPDTIPTFVSRNAAPLDTPDGVVRLDIIVDRSSVEAFANDGETTVCEQMFPDGGAYDVILSGDDAEFVALDLWTLKPIRT
jgi:levanase